MGSCRAGRHHGMRMGRGEGEDRAGDVLDLAPSQQSLLDSALAAFDPSMGDGQTGRPSRETIPGNIGAASLVCSGDPEGPPLSPVLAMESTNGTQGVRRLAKGGTPRRSDLDADLLIGRLRTRDGERLADQEAVWAMVDPSERRTSSAQERPDLMEVRALGARGRWRGIRRSTYWGWARGGVRATLSPHRPRAGHCSRAACSASTPPLPSWPTRARTNSKTRPASDGYLVQRQPPPPDQTGRHIAHTRRDPRGGVVSDDHALLPRRLGSPTVLDQGVLEQGLQSAPLPERPALYGS